MKDELINEVSETAEREQQETAQLAPELPTTLRGVAPVSGMPCEAGYKPVGDDCVMFNVPFE